MIDRKIDYKYYDFLGEYEKIFRLRIPISTPMAILISKLFLMGNSVLPLYTSVYAVLMHTIEGAFGGKMTDMLLPNTKIVPERRLWSAGG